MNEAGTGLDILALEMVGLGLLEEGKLLWGCGLGSRVAGDVGCYAGIRDCGFGC